MDRRRFHHALAWATAAACTGQAWAQTAVVQPEPTDNVYLTGVHSVLEVSVRNTFDTHKEAWPPTLLQHLKDNWANWLRFGPPKISEGSPWHKYEAFESLTRYASKRIWDLARTTLLVDVHLFSEADLEKLRTSTKQKLTDGNWLTAIFEYNTFDRLHHRILTEVVELHLAWLLPAAAASRSTTASSRRRSSCRWAPTAPSRASCRSPARHGRADHPGQHLPPVDAPGAGRDAEQFGGLHRFEGWNGPS
jgi:hypothetical protein